MVALYNEVKLITGTHLAFYRRHPWLMALFLLGFCLGSALLTAITGLNQEAKKRYQHSSALIKNPITHLIQPLTGKEFLDGEIWLHLRQQGITNAQPVLRGKLKTNQGRSLAIQGVDTLMWLNNRAFKKRETSRKKIPEQLSLSTLLVDSQFAQRIDSTKMDTFELEEEIQQPDIQFVDELGLWAITDIAHADYLLGAKGQLSFIELTHLTQQQIERITLLIQGKAQLIDVEKQSFDVLSEAFFFNLTALALLGYIVAAFLSFNAIKLTLSARRKLLSQMQLLGCTKQHIQLSLMIELVIVSLLTALIGASGGYLISNALVLDVNRTLVGLYQLDRALTIHWQWSNVLLGFALNIFALAFILISQINQVAKKGQAIFYFLFAIALVGTLWLLHYAATEFEALLLCFSLLMIFILSVPKAFSYAVTVPFQITAPLGQWLHADTRFHIKELHIAIIAILVALGSAIGMQIMVKSFSHTLNAHLEKQLSADIYLRSNQLNPALRQALGQLPEVKQISIYVRSDGKVNQIPAQLSSFGETSEHYQHISLISGTPVTEDNFQLHGCLANEQSKIKYGLALGDRIEFLQNETRYPCRITGFFYDYGNPSILLLTLEKRHQASKLNLENIGYSIQLNDNTTVAEFSERLVDEFKQGSTRIYPNKRFKQFANQLFDDTFVVTKALNGFILAIALLSLCTSLLSLSANQLKQLTILRSLGVTKQQLLRMKLIQTTGVVFFTVLFAIPLGFALGFSLLKFVMPIAFGWTIHFYLDFNALLITCITLVSISALCAYLPIRKLTSLEAREL
ncbi:ABC transporter permease [Algicola sagamiensis]|uniref:ABC transporter permease n=1 Tax=Algicola sagamiensis TaxID=163869 RepID=UPI00037C8F18|nr:FtsX-like permease family protein [Algicola sagamiensis]